MMHAILKKSKSFISLKKDLTGEIETMSALTDIYLT